MEPERFVTAIMQCRLRSSVIPRGAIRDLNGRTDVVMNLRENITVWNRLDRDRP